MNNYDIIITSLQRWDIEIGSNCKNIAVEFSKQNRVLYVNPPLDRISNIKGKKRYKKSGIVKVAKNIWVLYPSIIIESISRLPTDYIFDVLNKHNNNIFAREIKKAIKTIGFSHYIHFCDSDMFRSYHLKKLLKPLLSIYYSRDNLLAVKYWKTQGKRIEPRIMKNSDLVLTNSTYLRDLAKKYNYNSFFVGQGCDLKLFNKNKMGDLPVDIVDIPKPIIGYIGALKTLRLDIEIIEYIAMKNTKHSIVLVGPEDDDFKKSCLHDLPNVYFLGRKTTTELPLYLNQFDVAINPQKVNKVTLGNYPRKIDEYLALGKPTVATKTPAMDFFSEYVSLANNKFEWVSLIEEELATNTDDKSTKRENFAKQHTWENNIAEIYKRIKNTKPWKLSKQLKSRQS